MEWSTYILCTPASPQFTGPWNGNAWFPHVVIILKVLFNTYLFLAYPLLNNKLLWNVKGIECKINRNEACPTTPPMKYGYRSKLKVVLASFLILLFRQHYYTGSKKRDSLVLLMTSRPNEQDPVTVIATLTMLKVFNILPKLCLRTLSIRAKE